MCIFCEILSGRVEELPWAGNEPVDKYVVLVKLPSVLTPGTSIALGRGNEQNGGLLS